MQHEQHPLPIEFVDEAPELPLVQCAVRQCSVQHPEHLAALGACTRIEAFADGSTPIRNPGGPAGFAAVLLGWEAGATSEAPPAARLDFAGFVPPCAAPPTSNNRAELAGIMAALSALCALPAGPTCAVIWSDSDYAVSCACGRYRRRRNLDLWSGFDALYRQAQTHVPDLQFKWLRGHAGNIWNEAADALATRAAFQFDDIAYSRYRSAQQLSGREMPFAASGPRTTSAPLVASDTPASLSPTTPPAPRAAPIPADAVASSWIRGAHYTLVLSSQPSGRAGVRGGADPAHGRYQLWTRTGSGVQEAVTHAGDPRSVAAEYLTLLAALDNLLARIEAKEGDPSAYALTIYSSKTLLVKQLQGSYAVRADALRPLHAQAALRLTRFAASELIWRQRRDITELLGAVGRGGDP